MTGREVNRIKTIAKPITNKSFKQNLIGNFK